MTRPLLRPVLVAVALAAVFPVTAAAQSAVVRLFNGQDLSGWSHFLVDPKVPATDVWGVREGVLVCKGEPLGYLYTNTEYTSFKLVVEWRWAPGAAARLGKNPNSGVPKPKGVPRAYEAQLQAGSAGDLYGFWGMPLEGDAGRRREGKGHELLGDMVGFGKTEAAEKPEGEWNVYEITLDGPSLVVLVNGKKINEASGATVVPGHCPAVRGWRDPLPARRTLADRQVVRDALSRWLGVTQGGTDTDPAALVGVFVAGGFCFLRSRRSS